MSPSMSDSARSTPMSRWSVVTGVGKTNQMATARATPVPYQARRRPAPRQPPEFDSSSYSAAPKR